MPMMIVCDKFAYTPGQMVTGHVVIISKSPQKVKGLTMRFIGRASKLLGEVEGTKRYKKEVYFDEKMDIFGHDGSNTVLRVGETLYPFTFPLPPGLPSSYEWPDGNVLYFVEAKLTRASWKDKRVSSRIKVEGVYDLNYENSAVLPVEVKRQKYVKHLLSKSGPYGFTFKCARSGFVRGQSLPFSAEIRNLSKVDSRKFRISLLQEVKPEGGNKAVASLVEQIKGPAVTAGEVVTWEARLKIPGGIPPTNLGNVLSYPMVVPVNYFLHVQLSLKHCREDPICIKIPITIGTIPLQRRAISVPSLDEVSSSHLFPYSTNGHRVDCPLSQLVVPSGALSTSQFSPHLVSINSATSYTHTHVSRNHSLMPYHTFSPRSHRTQPSQILGPARQYEYYFEYEDANGSTRSVTSRGDALFHRRRHQAGGQGRNGRCLVPESPPPSYDEIFTGDSNTQGSGSHSNANNDNNNNNRPDIILTSSSSVTGEEVVHKRVVSAQLSSSSSSSSSEDDEDNSSLVLPLTNNASIISSANNNGSHRSSGSVTPTSSSSDSEDSGGGSATMSSATEEFLSCIGSSSSFEELKCDDLQNVGTTDGFTRLEEFSAGRGDEDEAELSGSHHRHHQKQRPCPCEKVNVNRSKSIGNFKDFQGGCEPSNNNNTVRTSTSFRLCSQKYADSTKCDDGDVNDEYCRHDKSVCNLASCDRDSDDEDDEECDSQKNG